MPSARDGMRASTPRGVPPSRAVKQRTWNTVQYLVRQHKSLCSTSLGDGGQTVPERRAGDRPSMQGVWTRQNPYKTARNGRGGGKPGHSHAVNQVRHKPGRDSEGPRNFLYISDLRKIQCC